MIEIKCKNCGKIFSIFPSEMKRRFCSKKCMYEGRKRKRSNLVVYTCKNCGVLFYDSFSAKRITCSLNCKHKVCKPTINENHHKFPKGYKPPHTGKKGWRHKKSFQKGHIPWNKNKKGYSTKLKGKKRPKSFGEAISRAKKRKIRLDRRGSNSNFWKGGVSKLADRIRRTSKYKDWVKSILIKDNWICQDCKKRGGYLEAHHKKDFTIILRENNITTLDEAYQCKELWDLENGRTLCLDCHIRNGRPNKNVKTF